VEITITEQCLSGGAVPEKVPFLDWFSSEDAIKNLIKDYYAHNEGAAKRPNGFVCAKTNVFYSTSDECLETYCQALRRYQSGKENCRKSDYLGASVSIEQNNPVLYYCRGYAYDFAMPIKTLAGEVVGAFIDGQLRPRIPLLNSVWFASKDYPEETRREILEKYLDMSVLDYDRACSIANYLQNEFAEKISSYNRGARNQGLDIKAFRMDAEKLGSSLKRAAINGLIKPMGEFVSRSQEISQRFCAIPMLSASTSDYHDAYFEITMQKSALNRPLIGCSLVTGQPSEEEKSEFREIAGLITTPRVLATGREGDFIRDRVNPYRAHFDKANNDIGCLTVGLVNGEQVGFLSVEDNLDNLGELSEPIRDVAQKMVSYLDRYSIAKDLTRCCGISGGEDSITNKEKLLAIIVEKSQTMIETESQGLEWLPMLINLGFALNLGQGLVDSLTSEEKVSIDNKVVSFFGSPTFSVIDEKRAMVCLRNICKKRLLLKPRVHERCDLPRPNYARRIEMLDEELRWLQEHEKYMNL